MHTVLISDYLVQTSGDVHAVYELAYLEIRADIQARNGYIFGTTRIFDKAFVDFDASGTIKSFDGYYLRLH